MSELANEQQEFTLGRDGIKIPSGWESARDIRDVGYFISTLLALNGAIGDEEYPYGKLTLSPSGSRHITIIRDAGTHSEIVTSDHYGKFHSFLGCEYTPDTPTQRWTEAYSVEYNGATFTEKDTDQDRRGADTYGQDWGTTEELIAQRVQAVIGKTVELLSD